MSQCIPFDSTAKGDTTIASPKIPKDEAPITVFTIPSRQCLRSGGALGGGTAKAAMLSGLVDTAPGTANLTLTSELDWAIWATTGTGTSSSKASTNDKTGGTIFGNLTETTGGTLRGGITSSQALIWTNGSTTPSGTNVTDLGLIFSSTLETTGRGVQLSVAGDPAVARVLRIWAAGNNGIGTFTASLSGASDVVLVSQEYVNSKTPTLFTITYQPNNVGDQLTLKYNLTTNGGGTNSHVGFIAAAVSAVPEPATSGLFLGATGLLLALRRRKGRNQ